MKVKSQAIAIATILFVLSGIGIHAADPIDVGSDKQLILDGRFLATAKGVTLKIHPPRKTGDLILKREHPWESATLNWFNVIQDQGRIDRSAKYRMWYEAYDIDGWPTADDTSFCYAESRDGIKWIKPELGLFTYKGNKRNNILFRQIGSSKKGNRSRVHGTGVFIDSKASPQQRYKAVGQGIFARQKKPPHRIAGMVSPDGLKWTRLSRPICNVFADSQYSGFWDPVLNRYVLYGRVGGRGRSLGRSDSVDFSHFNPLKLVSQVDDQDPPNSDLYNSAVMKYPYARNVYLMFPSLYQHGADTLAIRLAVSRDGIRWSRPDRKTAFIPLGKPNRFDSGSLYMGQGMIRVGDELWLYYSGSPLRHNEAELKNLTKPKNARGYSRVVMRLDRFVAAAAGANGGSFTTPPLRFTGKQLQLNAQVGRGGKLRVSLLDKDSRALPGYSLNDCRPIVGDSLSLPVTWRSDRDVSARAGKPTRLRVELTGARLFGFQFVAAKESSNTPRTVSQKSIDYLKKLRKRTPFGKTDFNLPQLRAGMKTRRQPTIKNVTLLRTKIGKIPCEWVVARGADRDVRLLYLHGGGFVSGSGAYYLPLAAHISAAAKCAVLLPDYRLAPEHRFPAGLEDCVTAHKWMVSNGPDGAGPAKATFIAGDSAGGSLTLATLLALRDRKLRLPAGGIPLSATTDLTLASKSLKTVKDPIISARTMPLFRDLYLGKKDPRNPLASPVFGDYRGIPPLLIQVGEHEMLRDDSIRVANKARKDGISVQLEVWRGMFHVFQSHEPLLPEARQSIKHMARFIRSKLPKP